MTHQETKENIHVDIPLNQDAPEPSQSIKEIFTEKFKKELDKTLMEFGKQNGFPVFFVISVKTFSPPQINPINKSITTSQTDVKFFKSSEKLAAANYAQKVLGTLGIFHPQITQVRSNDCEKI